MVKTWVMFLTRVTATFALSLTCRVTISWLPTETNTPTAYPISSATRRPWPTLPGCLSCAPINPETLTNRGGTLSDLGRYQEAIELDQRTLEIMERVLGPEHPYTLISRNNLAVCYRGLGRAPEAVELDERTLEIRERGLGPEHPYTLSSRNNLAIDYRALGRHADAERMEDKTPPPSTTR